MKLRILLTFLMLCSLAFAADFSGSYEATSDGEKYTLTLTQSGNDLSGEAKGEGQVYKLKGKVTGDKAAGTVTINGIPVTLHFKAEKNGSKLKLVVAPPGEDGKPDWSDADE